MNQEKIKTVIFLLLRFVLLRHSFYAIIHPEVVFMKLDLSQIKEITLGAVRIEEADNAVHFYRFTKHQQELYKARSSDFYKKPLPHPA